MKDQAKQLRALMSKKREQPLTVPSAEEQKASSVPCSKQLFDAMLARSKAMMETVNEEEVMTSDECMDLTLDEEALINDAECIGLSPDLLVELPLTTDKGDELEQRLNETIESESEFSKLKDEFVQSSTQDILVYAIGSGKGGVGKTNFTLNLAIMMQRLGRRVLIIDTDYGFTNIDVLCGLVTHYSLQDVLNGNKSLTEVLVEGPEGVKFIPGGNNVVGINEMTDEHQLLFQSQFSELEDIDVILIDMGAGISKLSIMYTMFAQELLMVTTPEPTSLADAYSFLKVIDEYQLKEKVKVIVNRATTSDEARRTFESLNLTAKYHLSLELEQLGEIKDDLCVSNSVKVQTPFVIHAANSQPTRDVESISRQLLQIEHRSVRFQNIQQVVGRLIRVFN